MINEMHHFFTDASRRLTVRLVSAIYDSIYFFKNCSNILSTKACTDKLFDKKLFHFLRRKPRLVVGEEVVEETVEGVAAMAAVEGTGQVEGTVAGVPADMKIEVDEVLGEEVMKAEEGLAPGEVSHLAEGVVVEVQAGGEAAHLVAEADPPIRQQRLVRFIERCAI